MHHFFWVSFWSNFRCSLQGIYVGNYNTTIWTLSHVFHPNLVPLQFCIQGFHFDCPPPFLIYHSSLLPQIFVLLQSVLICCSTYYLTVLSLTPVSSCSIPTCSSRWLDIPLCQVYPLLFLPSSRGIDWPRSASNNYYSSCMLVHFSLDNTL